MYYNWKWVNHLMILSYRGKDEDWSSWYPYILRNPLLLEIIITFALRLTIYNDGFFFLSSQRDRHTHIGENRVRGSAFLFCFAGHPIRIFIKAGGKGEGEVSLGWHLEGLAWRRVQCTLRMHPELKQRSWEYTIVNNYKTPPRTTSCRSSLKKKIYKYPPGPCKMISTYFLWWGKTHAPLLFEWRS